MFIGCLNANLENQKFLAIMQGADPEKIKDLRYDLDVEAKKQIDQTERALKTLGVIPRTAGYER